MSETTCRQSGVRETRKVFVVQLSSDPELTCVHTTLAGACLCAKARLWANSVVNWVADPGHRASFRAAHYVDNQWPKIGSWVLGSDIVTVTVEEVNP